MTRLFRARDLGGQLTNLRTRMVPTDRSKPRDNTPRVFEDTTGFALRAVIQLQANQGKPRRTRLRRLVHAAVVHVHVIADSETKNVLGTQANTTIDDTTQLPHIWNNHEVHAQRAETMRRVGTTVLALEFKLCTLKYKSRSFCSKLSQPLLSTRTLRHRSEKNKKDRLQCDLALITLANLANTQANSGTKRSPDNQLKVVIETIPTTTHTPGWSRTQQHSHTFETIIAPT